MIPNSNRIKYVMFYCDDLWVSNPDIYHDPPNPHNIKKEPMCARLINVTDMTFYNDYGNEEPLSTAHQILINEYNYNKNDNVFTIAYKWITSKELWVSVNYPTTSPYIRKPPRSINPEFPYLVNKGTDEEYDSLMSYLANGICLTEETHKLHLLNKNNFIMEFNGWRYSDIFHSHEQICDRIYVHLRRKQDDVYHVKFSYAWRTIFKKK